MRSRVDARIWWLVVWLACGLLLSGISPYDRATWFMEIAPVLIVVPILLGTHKGFPLSTLAYTLIGVHAAILMIGGHWSYARVPFGFTLQQAMHLARNPYDRIGHLAQGFIPAIIAREILRRQLALRGRWLFGIVCCICLAISATYELVEWGAAIALGAGADDFLGTQGDPWDTQWDMAMALVGSIAAQVLLARLHDRQLAAVEPAAR